MRKFYIAKGFENRDVILPKRGTSKSAGYDFSTLEEITIKPNEKVLVNTGVKAEMEDDEVLLIFPRSSIAVKKGLQLTNSVAVIDADYFSNPNNDGHIMIPLNNISSKEVTLQKGERIAQGIFVKYLITDDDNSTSSRVGGYGSTGEK